MRTDTELRLFCANCQSDLTGETCPGCGEQFQSGQKIDCVETVLGSVHLHIRCLLPEDS